MPRTETLKGDAVARLIDRRTEQVLAIVERDTEDQVTWVPALRRVALQLHLRFFPDTVQTRLRDFERGAEYPARLPRGFEWINAEPRP